MARSVGIVKHDIILAHHTAVGWLGLQVWFCLFDQFVYAWSLAVWPPPNWELTTYLLQCSHAQVQLCSSILESTAALISFQIDLIKPLSQDVWWVASWSHMTYNKAILLWHTLYWQFLWVCTMRRKWWRHLTRKRSVAYKQQGLRMNWILLSKSYTWIGRSK